MTNGTAPETNGITSEAALLPCPYCGGDCATVISEWQEYLDKWGDEFDESGLGCSDYRAVVCDVTKGGCGAIGGWREWEKEAIEAWNTRAAVTDHDFAMAAHDGRTWVCVEGALESDVLKPIEGFTRDSIYRDSMREYGEWMEKATDLMRDLYSGFECCVAKVCDACPSSAKLGDAPCAIEERLREFGIEV